MNIKKSLFVNALVMIIMILGLWLAIANYENVLLGILLILILIVLGSVVVWFVSTVMHILLLVYSLLYDYIARALIRLW